MIKKCEYCQNEYETKNKARKFCSLKCYQRSPNFKIRNFPDREGNNNSRWNGGRSRGYILKKAKGGVLSRGGNLNVCEICGRKKEETRIAIHHKDRNNQNNNPENLMVLCYYCHEKEHFEDKHKDFATKNNFQRDKNGRFVRKKKTNH